MTPYTAPLVIGVTGHRDLVDGELEALATHVESFFDELKGRYPDTPLHLLSSIAETW